MSSGFKNYKFHREYHKDLMQNQAYVMLPLDCIGALAKIRNLAGLTDNSGSLRIGGSERLSFKETCKWLVQTPELKARRARAILFRLVFDKFLTVVTKEGKLIEVERAAGEWVVKTPRVEIDEAVVMVPNWDLEQHEQAPSDEAERKRNQRERERESGRGRENEEESRGDSEVFPPDGSTGVREFPKDSADLGVTCHTDCKLKTANCRKGDIPLHCKLSAAAGGRPPPPQLRSRKEQNGTGGTGAGGSRTVQTKTQSQTQTQSQKQTALQAAPAVPEQSGGGGRPPAGGMIPGDDLYGLDPIEAYCLILGDHKQIARRNAQSKLRMACVVSGDDDLGRQKFFQALAIMREVLHNGTMPERLEDGSPCVPWKYFEGVFKNVLEDKA